jgi:antitoxin (DNA-binding transcriptional repressor) of toxin-antitoxin stability system
MQTIQVSEAERDFRRVMDQVERGETVVITRDGQPIMRMSPDSGTVEKSEIDQRSVDEAMASILEIRKRTMPVSLEELFSARDEGRR